MSEARIRTDMEFLAGRLAHRGSNTESERQAAEYLRDQLRESTPDVEIDDFYCSDNPRYLFASYYAEFVVVSLFAVWWPKFAICYGAIVLLAYLAEFSGYALMARFLPQYETQNVVARFLATRPERLIVLMAHYDSGRLGPTTYPRRISRMHWIHAIFVGCMIFILLSCAAQILGLFDGAPVRVDLILRWTAAGILLSGAIILFFLSGEIDYARGANDNASGTAVLLDIARRLASEPIADADVYIVATGSNETWMHGARQFLKTHRGLDKERTHFLNVDSVGAGDLAYTERIGLTHFYPCDREMASAAAAVAPAHGAIPCDLRDPYSDAMIPLTRGYKTLGIAARLPEPPPGEIPRPTDTLADIDFPLVARAADFAWDLVKRLAAGQ